MAVEFNHFPEAIKALHDAARDHVANTTETVQSRAAGLAAYDTGFMSQSIYRITYRDDTYGQGGNAGSKGGYLVARVEGPENDQEGIVATGANYSIYQNFGTRFMPAHPFMEPAAEATRGEWMAGWDEIEGQIARAVG